jgi:hypothetical protein
VSLCPLSAFGLTNLGFSYMIRRAWGHQRFCLRAALVQNVGRLCGVSLRRVAPGERPRVESTPGH